MTFNINEKEMDRIMIIEKIIDKRLVIQDAKKVLKLSERQIYRLIKRYKEYGPPGMVHGLRGKESNHKGDSTRYGKIKGIFRRYSKYHDFGPTLMAEHLESDFGIIINKETLRQIMIKEGIWIAKKKVIKIKHMSRERRPTKGDLIQFDGTYHDWFENKENHCLLCAVDDATSEIYIKFTKGETYEEVVEFWIEYIKEFGKPQAIYLDRHATYKVNNPKDQWDKEIETCFKRGMRKLGIEVIYARSPEGKGRVERGNGTHQDRLVKKMRLKGIKTIEEANKYVEEYMKGHNKRYSVKAKQEGSSFIKPKKEEIDNIYRYFSKISIRTIKRDGTLQYNNKKYQFEKGLILKSNKIYVKETMNNDIRFYDGNTQIIPIKSV